MKVDNNLRPVKHSVVALALIFTMASLLLNMQQTYDAKAIDAKNFDAGNIIDDTVFYKYSSMNVNDIQAFLNSKVPTCQTDTKPYTQAKAPCLKDYIETTKNKSADNYCKGYTAKSNETSAQIIHNVAQSCGINPQVILVMLQKEQGLVLDTWPRDGWLVWGCKSVSEGGSGGCVNFQYRSAMGYGCPDTAACDSTYYGFFNQVYMAARQFKLYQAKPNSYNYVAGRNNTILWNPSSSCGSSTLYIKNQATAGLYNYTPYRPNLAALTAGYATGDGCSSYGNRNFYLYFTDWFGPTTVTVNGTILDRYNQAGGSLGILGKPIDNEVAIDNDSSYQIFENGAIIGSASTGYWESVGPIRDRWAQLGYQTGKMGYPIGPVTTSADEKTSWQAYKNGYIIWGDQTGAWESKGAIREYWAKLGYQTGYLGYPIGPETYDSNTATWSQTFQYGTIYHKLNGASWSVKL